MNWCRPEQMGTKEFGKLMIRIQILEEGRVPAKQTKEYQWLLNKFEMEVSFNGTKRLVELGKGDSHEGKRRVAQ